jgi:hypothetical protein
LDYEPVEEPLLDSSPDIVGFFLKGLASITEAKPKSPGFTTQV